MSAKYDKCPNCKSKDTTRVVYSCTKCKFEGCWDKYGNGCWPKYLECPSCHESGHYTLSGNISGQRLTILFKDLGFIVDGGKAGEQINVGAPIVNQLVGTEAITNSAKNVYRKWYGCYEIVY